MEERNYKLYVHISPSNKRYYGITCKKRVQDRWNNGKRYVKNKHFTRAINKYGWENFEHIVLFDNLTIEEASLLEQMYIALYDTFDNDYGYNQSLGGEHGLHREESKKKISESMKGKNKGKVAWNKDKPLSDETKKKISESLKGHETTEETRKKLGEAKKGKNNHNSKPVLMFTKEGEFVRRFDCVADANEYLCKDGNNHNIHNCARGDAKTAFGYIWIYEEDYIKEQQQAI